MASKTLPIQEQRFESHPGNLPGHKCSCLPWPSLTSSSFQCTHSSAAHEAATGHSCQYFIFICWTGNYSHLPATLYTTHRHSEGQNSWGPMRNQYRYSIAAHHHKRYTHTHSKVGKAIVSSGRGGQECQRDCQANRGPWALGHSVGLKGDGGKRALTACLDNGSSRAGKQGGCLCSYNNYGLSLAT